MIYEVMMFLKAEPFVKDILELNIFSLLILLEDFEIFFLFFRTFKNFFYCDY